MSLVILLSAKGVPFTKVKGPAVVSLWSIETVSLEALVLTTSCPPDTNGGDGRHLARLELFEPEHHAGRAAAPLGGPGLLREQFLEPVGKH
jgi:hypothetical protein